MSNDMRPRDYGWEAHRIWMERGRDAAIAYITDVRPKEWRRLVYTHAKIATEKAYWNGKKIPSHSN